MFERFSREARTAVVAAQTDARAAGRPRIDAAGLLAAALRTDPATAAALRAAGVDTDRLATAPGDPSPGPDAGPASSGALDAQALASVGIDLDAVRREADALFGPGALDRPAGTSRGARGGHVPFEKDAKKMLELALREAVRRHERTIETRHLVLAALRDTQGSAHAALTGAMAPGADVETVRAALDRTGGLAA
ncbi:Clp protease N-terminal domain-containing protein [Cellulomonas sp. PhB143]|uniref:Clp protease N-terminal domain-containing protein n=1 Tax=Cellulomonas sp. PhB143 TaxID=2485186 RepID=UPI000F47DE1D|nr:Clp protease N-terminal domain-containing protein [Cellulomonas sp. PhB143]ROS79028.1 ClpA/ClpB-like protein [Cellulomonas sp. PhB143]